MQKSPNRLPNSELATRLNELDEEMKREGTPLRFRPLECFKRLYGSVDDQTRRSKLFDPITLWFVERYGEWAAWDAIVARIPVIIREELYLAQVPFVTENTLVRMTDRIEGLPKHVAETFTEDEFKELAPKVNAASECSLKLYTLNVDDHILNDDERGLVRRALYDFEHTATSLRYSGDTQNAIFHSHAAAEKFLKAALKRAGGQQELKGLGHNLPRVFRELTKIQKRFEWLRSSVHALQLYAPSMEIRYANVPRTIQEAVIAFNAALNICGTIAGIWLFDLQRGTCNAEFRVGSFYVDFAGRTFRCLALPTAEKASLKLFTAHPMSGLIMADMVVPAVNASLYLEVTDSSEVKALESRYQFHLANRGRRVTPEEMGVKITSGPEGSYVNGVLRLRLDRPPKTSAGRPKPPRNQS